LAAVALWVWHWYRTTEPVEHPMAQPYTGAQRFAVILILPLFAICVGMIRAHDAISPLHGIRPVADFTADAVVTAIATFALGLLALGLFLRRREAAGAVS